MAFGANDNKLILSESITVPSKRRKSAVFLKYLRKIHLYVGLWGAALGLVFGATGILLNHRASWAAPLQKPVQYSVQLALPEAPFIDAPALALWLRKELKINPQASERAQVEPERSVTWNDQTVQQPARWSFNFQSLSRAVSAEYFPGNRFIKVDLNDQSPLGTLTRLHKGAGASLIWVLIADTIGTGLIVLSITGLLLWTRMHPLRLTTVAVASSALLGGIWSFWTAF